MKPSELFRGKRSSDSFSGRRIIESADSTVDNIVLILLIIMLMFGLYSMIDSKLVYMSADASNYEIYRPTEDNSKSFAELQKINPDVFAWLTVIGTQIDYPVCQGEDNEKYVNTDAEGNHSLTGSLFLDSRNKKDFSDYNNIIYGHHMEQHKFFGCFDEYKDQKYFEEHSRANLYYGGRKHGVELFAFVMADAYDINYYTVHGQQETEGKEYYLEYLKNHAMHARQVDVTTQDTLIVLSTCTEDITNGRFLLVGKLRDKPFKEPPRQDSRSFGQGLLNSTGIWALLPLWKWLILFAIAFLALVAGVTYLYDRWKIRKGWKGRGAS